MSSLSPFLSIIIVAYKSCDEIGRCLASLPSELNRQPLEVIIVDNSPGDGTEEIVRRDFDWVQYVSAETNLGFGRANNLGFARSVGQCVLFLNPDTVCNVEAIAHCATRAQTELDIGIISPKLTLADGSMDLACRRSIPTMWDGFCRATNLSTRFPQSPLFSKYNLTYLPSDGTYDVGAINGAFMMGRREVFQHVGLFDESFFMYGDDLDLCIRVSKAGYRVVYDGRLEIIHLKGVSVAKNYDKMAEAIFDANRDVYLKHFNPRGSRFIAWKYLVSFGLWKKVALWRGRQTQRRLVRPI